jgi:hypothetical protein
MMARATIVGMMDKRIITTFRCRRRGWIDSGSKEGDGVAVWREGEGGWGQDMMRL